MTERQPPTTQEYIDQLLHPARQEELDTFLVMSFMPIDPYERVADIGCGPGYFSIPLAKHLVHGKLYALDIDDEMLDALRLRVEEAKLGNVEVLKCGATDFPVEAESLDGVLLAFVTHQSEDRIDFLEAVRDLLRARGWCVVLEWYRKATESGPPLERRIDPGELEALAGETGYRFRWWRDLNGSQYMALIRK